MTRCLRRIIASYPKYFLMAQNRKMSAFADDGFSSEIISDGSQVENPIILGRPTISMSQLASNRVGERTLVILLGWAACRDEHLQKYSDIYAQKSVETHLPAVAIVQRERLHRTRPTTNRSARNGKDRSRRFCLRNISRVQPAWMLSFEAVWTLLGDTPDGLRLKHELTKAIVFDSCPALPNAHESAMALTIINDHATPQAVSVFSVRYAAYLLAFLAKNGINKVFHPRRFVYHRLLAHDTLPDRQLYLYSDADVLCSARTIATFAQLQSRRKCAVKEYRWKDSPHVNHFRTHPREYVAACHQLIDEVAGNSSKL